MSLIQLISSGYQNVYMNVPIKYCCNNSSDDLIDKFENNCLIPNIKSDTILPEYLEIELKHSDFPVNFEDLCHKVCFEMEIYEKKILSIPLRFMNHIKKYEMNNGKYYIQIPFKMFCDDIIYILNINLVFKLTNVPELFSSVKLISSKKYYDRKLIDQNEGIHNIHILKSIEINCSNQTEFNINVPFTTIHKGFFIECNNVDEINGLSLYLYNEIHTSYNKFFIDKKCIKVSDKLLYFPFNYEKSYFDRTNDSFEGSMNLSRVYPAVLNVQFTCAQQKICIYGLGSGLLTYGKDENPYGSYYGYIGHLYYNYNREGKYTVDFKNDDCTCLCSCRCNCYDKYVKIINS